MFSNMTRGKLKLAVFFVVAITLSACASKSGVAPVESRTPGTKNSASVQANQESVPPVARPGFYIVKKGDTLFSIAHQNERDYRELAAWNGLDDANVIKVGQELRITPPEQTAGNQMIAPPPAIEARPLDSPKPGTPASSPASTKLSESITASVTKTEPKGGRVPYSAQAWKDLQNRDREAPNAVPATTASTPVASNSAPKAESKAPSSSSEAKDAKAGDETSVDWIWPSSGKVIGSFNDASNKGIDIAGNLGDPVLAAAAGRVVYVGTGVRGYGNLVIVKHNNSNFISAYAHNSEVFVKEGQTVQKGQKIAALGNSDSDRAKLHFEIRRQGRPVDPAKYLPNR